MATPWPSTLPDYFLKGGLGGAFGDPKIRSTPDVGPAKQRRRTTAAPDRYTGKIRMTATQFGTFKTFGKSTLAGWTLPFAWKDPVSRAACDMQFVGVPSWVPYGIYWDVTVTVEILP
jgi:hypothetical protein